MNAWQDLMALEWRPYVMALVIVVISLLVARLVSNAVGRVVTQRLDIRRGFLARAIAFYGMLLLGGVLVLAVLKVPLSALLAAGGMVGIAIGFVSQTALSNLISGIFLTFEQPFSVGDAVQIEGTVGTVESISMLSTYVRTFDNVFVRLPNETVLKSKVTTLTRYGIRRVDLPISVSYSDDLDTALQALIDCALAHPSVMRRPEPLAIVLHLAPSGVDLQLRAWLPTDQWFEASHQLRRQMKDAILEAGCTIPLNQVVLHHHGDPPETSR